MKKNKIIIPAMAMILFSTAASISGTVAWFTASRVFETTVGNFSVVEIDGSLDVKMGAGQGTILDEANNTVSVRNATYLNDNKKADPFSVADAEPAGSNGDIYYNTAENKAYKHDGTDWGTGFDLNRGDIYYDSTAKKYYVATGTASIDDYNNVVLTHGSYNHNNGHGYVIDNDSDPTDPSYIDKDPDEDTNWLQKAAVSIPDASSNPQIVDVYNVVSWTMTFNYTYAGDSAPIGVYLDLKKSTFESAVSSPDFRKPTGSPKKTSKGFRVSFSEAVYAVGQPHAGEDAANAHDLVWGNNDEYLMAVPEPYAGSRNYEKGKIVRDGGKVYKANKAITGSPADLVEADWDVLYDLPDYSNESKYAIGDKVVSASKVYKCITAINTPGGFDTAKWLDLTTLPTAYTPSANYTTTGTRVLYNGKIYANNKAVNPAPAEFNVADWDETNLLTLNARKDIYSAYNPTSGTYNVGDKVLEDGVVYECVTKIDTAPHAWNVNEWKAINANDTDLTYVNSESATAAYDSSNYVVSNSGYVKFGNLNAHEAKAFGATSAAERICVLTKDQPKVTVKCSAWFEGSDPNVITGAVMECLQAKMSFYSRTINN